MIPSRPIPSRAPLKVEPLPDVMVLRSMDVHMVQVMRTRIAQARERISRIDPSKNIENTTRQYDRVTFSLSWYTSCREGLSLAETKDNGLNLSFSATSEVMNFSFLDETVSGSKPKDVGIDTSRGLEMVHALLDRFEALASLPLIRMEQTRRRRGSEADGQPLDPAGVRYRESLDRIVRRYEILHDQYGSRDAMPKRVRLTPPSPMRHADLIGPQERISILTAEGRRRISQDITTALTLRIIGDQQFAIADPEIDHDQIPLEPIDPIRTLREIGVISSAKRPEMLLAPRLRRR